MSHVHMECIHINPVWNVSIVAHLDIMVIPIHIPVWWIVAMVEDQGLVKMARLCMIICV